MLVEEDKQKVFELISKLKIIDEEFQSLKFLYESSNKSLEDKSLEFKKLFEELVIQLDICCKKIEVLLEVKINELINISSSKINVIFFRIFYCQYYIIKVKEVLLIKICIVFELEVQFRQLIEEQNVLNIFF